MAERYSREKTLLLYYQYCVCSFDFLDKSRIYPMSASTLDGITKIYGIIITTNTEDQAKEIHDGLKRKCLGMFDIRYSSVLYLWVVGHWFDKVIVV